MNGNLRSALASWNDSAAKQSIIDFVGRVTTVGDPDFVPVVDRIAVFDNDGTLWAESPVPVQLAFLLDRVHALASKHPEWQHQQPFKAVLENDMKAVAATGMAGLEELGMATHAGMTTEEFELIVKDWIATARHPKFNRPYTELTYQPMLEVLAFLRAHDFKTFIVSGGGIEFMRTFSETIYGIPPENVVGSSIVTKYEVREASRYWCGNRSCTSTTIRRTVSLPRTKRFTSRWRKNRARLRLSSRTWLARQPRRAVPRIWGWVAQDAGRSLPAWICAEPRRARTSDWRAAP